MNLALTNPTRIDSAGQSELDLLWVLFKEYHNEISVYSEERPLPSEKEFKDFWLSPEKYSLISYSGKEAIGFTLMQLIEDEELGKYLEVGSIYLTRDHRKGLNALRLYNEILFYGQRLQIPIGSEISSDNKKSLKLARALSKRYIRQNGNGTLSERILKNGRHFLLFSSGYNAL